MDIVFVILSTPVLFLALIMVMAAKPKFTAQVTSAIFVIVAVTGLFFYGYGFMVTTNDFGLTVVRSLLAVCGMYMGRMDWGAISAAPLMQLGWMQLLFWTVHLLALYATASAAVITVGAEALRKLRLWLARRGKLNIIYGVNNETLSLGKQILSQKLGAVVFVDVKADPANAAAIAKAGCVLRSDDSAIRADADFLKAVGACRKGRKINVYAMEAAASDSLHYAQRLLKTLEASGVQPEQTSLVIRAQENSSASTMQVLGDKYGYGTVTVVQEASLAARTLILNYPPCDHISFDENGRATEDFEALIIGFGYVGQNVLRQLVMNGQFEGSRFRAAIFSPDCNAVKGYFSKNYAQVLKHYDISFHACDARSEELYDYLLERMGTLKYMAICTGSDKLNLEIAEDVTDYLGSVGFSIPVYLCSHRGVKHFNPVGKTVKTLSLYRPEVLSMEKMDELAMLVNSRYQADQEKTPREHWMNCDYFSRMSCRATADFIPAMLRMAGKTQQQVREEGWALTDAQLENLGRAEHLRWCAFHFCMGFAPMSPEEYDEREARYLQQVAAGEKPLRVGKNMQKRTHACLIGWEELDALSQRESRLTGKNLDYKAMDTDNVLLIPELLRAQRKTEV